MSPVKLAIELDGEYHVYNKEHDSLKDDKFDSYVITTYRYENRMVFEHPNVIIDDIKASCQSKNISNKTTSPRFQRGTPPYQGGELIPFIYIDFTKFK